MATSAASTSPFDFFPRSSLYAALLRPRTAGPSAVRDPARARSAFAYSERHLQCVWYDPALRPAGLKTRDGEEVQIESPGVWNLEAGPDFLGAALRVGGRRIEGDAEVHVHPRDWELHGHAADPRYRRVRVHISYFPGTGGPAVLPPGAVHIALKDALASNPCFSFEAVDLAAYPYAVRAEMPPCARLLARWQPTDKAALLDAAGEERLRRKAERLAAAIEERGAEQVLYEEVFCALGYKHNKAPFRHLAGQVTLEALRDETAGDPDAAYALLAGVAGLLPDQIANRWDAETRAFVRRLWDAWWKRRDRWAARIMPKDDWRLSGLRPPNQPARRLAAAAHLFTQPAPLSEQLLALADGKSADFPEQAAALVSGPAGTYWDHRLSFSGSRQRKSVSLIGAGRAAALVTNVFVPFVAALGRKSPLAPAVLDRLPAEADNAVVRQAAHTLFGPDHNPRLYRSDLRRQGLIQIFHDFCLNDRSRCASCPLPAALEQHRTIR